MLCKQWPCKCIKNITGNWHFYHDFMILYYYLKIPANFVIYIQVQDFHGEKRPKFPPFFSLLYTQARIV